jgi:hypothetical protein
MRVRNASAPIALNTCSLKTEAADRWPSFTPLLATRSSNGFNLLTNVPVLQLRPMTVLLAVFLSGVLLDHRDRPMSIYHLTFISADGKLIEAITTGKDGKFQVDLAPGTYRLQFGFDGTMETIIVDKSTSTLKLKLPAPPSPPPPYVIEIIQGHQRAILPLPGPPAPPPQPQPPHVIEAPKEPHWYFDIPLHSNPNPPA